MHSPTACDSKLLNEFPELFRALFRKVLTFGLLCRCILKISKVHVLKKQKERKKF
jgi:hypothetical protein